MKAKTKKDQEASQAAHMLYKLMFYLSGKNSGTARQNAKRKLRRSTTPKLQQTNQVTCSSLELNMNKLSKINSNTNNTMYSNKKLGYPRHSFGTRRFGSSPHGHRSESRRPALLSGHGRLKSYFSSSFLFASRPLRTAGTPNCHFFKRVRG